MDAGYGPAMYHKAVSHYSAVDALLDGVSRRMASSSNARPTRTATGQKTSGSIGGSMRIVKTSSASNSPRGSRTLGRRRTVMSDGQGRRRIVLPEQQPQSQTGDVFPYAAPSNRPVSWHPSSHLTAPQIYQPIQQTYPRTEMGIEFPAYDISQTPAVYSGYTSPTLAFSPPSMPFTEYDQHQQYMFAHSYIDNTGYPHFGFEQAAPDYLAVLQASMEPSMYAQFGWSNPQTAGLVSSTSPPTPDNFLPGQHPVSSFVSEEAIPYHALSDEEPEGEELIGMGLYDTPEAPKSPFEHQLDGYRSMYSQIVGPQHRRVESTGKGLKLEETWNPPPSDDEEDEDVDGEGEDDDEVSIPEGSATVTKDDASMNHNKVAPTVLPGAAPKSYSSLSDDRDGWL